MPSMFGRYWNLGVSGSNPMPGMSVQTYQLKPAANINHRRAPKSLARDVRIPKNMLHSSVNVREGHGLGDRAPGIGAG